MTTVKTLYWVLVATFTVGFLDGFFEIGFSDDFYILLGAIMIVCFIWLGRTLYKK
jgi:hypothetical protein